MRKFLQLYRREFSLRVWQSWLLGLAALGIQPMLTGIAGVRHGERFETMYGRSAAPAAVAILAALAAGWMVYSVLRDFRGGMDTLLTLPYRREWAYLAKMAAFGSLLLVLFAGLLGGVFASYGVYLYQAARFPAAAPWPMENGLLLALCRSSTLRLLFPLEPPEISQPGKMESASPWGCPGFPGSWQGARSFSTCATPHREGAPTPPARHVGFLGLLGQGWGS